MLLFVGMGLILAGCAFVVPLSGILRVSGSQRALAWTVFWLALQVLATIPLGQIIGIYRTFGQAHRGVMWGNLYRIMLLAVTIGLAALQAPFWLIAAGQMLSVLAILVSVVLFLRWSKPEVSPRLDYWDPTLARQILKPSAFFGLFMINNFLVYQAPVLLLQRFVGAQAVVVFSVARTLFSFVRQGVGLVQQSIAPEVTRLYGLGDKERLIRLYVLFERVILTAVLIVNVGSLLLAPTLLALWLKRPELFQLSVFIGVMTISIVSSLKEYKIYFQYTTNNHVKTGLTTFLTYISMILASVPLITRFGLQGFLAVWLFVELVQTCLLHFYNTRFFAGRREISLQPSLRMGLVLIVVLIFAAFAQSLLESRSYWLRGAIVVLAVTSLAGVSYFLFGFREVMEAGKAQLLKFGTNANDTAEISVPRPEQNASTI
jgi:O-antigen/teichoic acid export membrane protein